MLRLSLLFCLFSCLVFSQDAKQYSIMLETEVGTESNSDYIDISWQNDSTSTKYIVAKRVSNDSLFTTIAELSGGANSFRDLDATEYQEYEVTKEFTFNEDEFTTKAYKEHCIDCNLVEEEIKSLLILVDRTLSGNINPNLQRYINKLQNEGWNPIVQKVDRVEEFNPKAVINNKLLINQIYESAENLKAILILGRVAVPYSGDLAPDGHGDNDEKPHKGAYPTDAYYADFDYQNWTDSSAENIKSAFDRQHNVVNDGKWDQSYIPGEVELSVGRVDFYNLPEFEESESELINRYLDKVIDYKTGKTKPNDKAILYDGFVDYQRGYAADGWNNLTTLYGRDKVTEMPVREELYNNRYDMVFTCAPGDFNNIYLAIYYNELAANEYKATHNMIFGSYNVDWDSENNVHRSVLASEGYGLTSIWGTRPFNNYFQLGLGRTFGEVMRNTQNNIDEYEYPSTKYNGSVHTFLMGDPTLKLINENAIENVSFDFGLLSIEIEDMYSIWGYQVLSTDEGLKILETVRFDKPASDEINSIFNHEREVEYIIRPIIKINNRSGSFFYLGNGDRLLF